MQYDVKRPVLSNIADSSGRTVDFRRFTEWIWLQIELNQIHSM